MILEINKLKSDEFSRLIDFVNSPYFNKSDSYKRLFAYLKRYYPEIKKEHISHKELSINVYREDSVNPEKIRKLISGFSRLIEKFILSEEINSDDMGTRLLMLKAARKRFLEELYDKRLNELKEMKLSRFGKDEMVYLNKMNYYEEMFISSFPLKNSRAHYYSGKKIYYLNYYFIYQTLVFNINFQSDKIARKTVSKQLPNMTNEVFKFVENNIRHISERFPDIITLYYANSMFITGNINFYNKLVKYFNSNKHKFDHNLRTLYFMVCENFLKLNNSVTNDMKNRKRLFELRKEILRNKHFKMFFVEGRMIPTVIFFSVFNDAVNLKEFDWAEKFVRETKKFLSLSDEENVLNTVMMILNFFKGETEDIFRLINKTNKNNTRQFIYSRFIKMMLFYETDSMQELHYETEAFRKYLTRKKDSGTTAKLLIGKSIIFLKCMNRLIKLKSSGISSDRSKLHKRENNYYKNYKSPEYEFWFEEKIDEIVSS